jgi:hypothetical protein
VAGFLGVLRFLLPPIPSTAPHSSSIIRGWYNRPNNARHTKSVSPHPKKQKRKHSRSNFMSCTSFLYDIAVQNKELRAELVKPTFLKHKFPSKRSYTTMLYGSVVGTATAYGLDDRGVGVRVPVVKNFHFSISSRPDLGSIQPPVQWVQGALFSRGGGVKWQGRKVDHSTPTSAEIKKTWTYTSTTPYIFMAYCLIS